MQILTNVLTEMALQQQDESAESGRRDAVDAALATPPPPSSSSGRRDADWDASPGVDSEDSGFQLEEPVAEAGPTPTPTALVSASPTPAAADAGVATHRPLRQRHSTPLSSAAASVSDSVDRLDRTASKSVFLLGFTGFCLVLLGFA